MDWLDFKVCQGLLDHPGRKVQLDLRARREMPVALDPEGQMVLMEGWGNWVSTVDQDPEVPKVKQARKVHQAIWDPQDLLDFLESLLAMMLVPCLP